MKELCIVHIGMPKTGSTSIQSALYSGLDTNEVRYANLPGAYHSGLLFSCFCDLPTSYHFNIASGRSASDIEKLNTSTLNLLAEGFSDGINSTVIISSEDFYHLSDAGVARLKKFLDRYFKKVKIVAYVRPLKPMLESAFQQLVKFHSLCGFGIQYIYHPYRNFIRYDKEFGSDNVQLRIFEEANFPNEDVVNDFSSWLGFDIQQCNTIKENEGISCAAVSYLFAYNLLNTVKSSFLDDYSVNFKLVELLRQIQGGKFKLSSSFISAVRGLQCDDLNWIEERLGMPIIDSQYNSEIGFDNERDFLMYSLDCIPQLTDLVSKIDICVHTEPNSLNYVCDVIRGLKTHFANKHNLVNG